MLEFADISKINAADWLELNFIISNIKILSKEVLTSNIDDYYEEKQEENVDVEFEDLMNNMYNEITNRKRILTDKYFLNNSIDTIDLNINIRNNEIYKFMLFLSTHNIYGSTKLKGKKLSQAAMLFEEVITDILEQFSGNAKRIGHPRRNMPTNLKNSINVLCEYMNEPFNSFDDLPKYSKDADVDIISWKPYDCRPGQQILLVSCKCSPDWEEETIVPLDLWTSLINFRVHPHIGFAIPHVISDIEKWNSQSKIKGILFDRLRVLNITSKIKDVELNREIKEWNNAQCDLLRRYKL